MAKGLGEIFRRCLEKPAYFGYFIKNVHPVRDHFPSLYAALERRKSNFDLGGGCHVSKLHVILRTTDAVMNLNASRGLEHLGLETKRDVIAHGGCTVFAAARVFVRKFGHARLRVTLVVDGLSEAGLTMYRERAAFAGIDFDVVQSKGHGNGPSFQTQIDIALQDDENGVALILEDDYALDEDALVYPFLVLQSHTNVAGINPHFHPDRVRFQDIGKLVVLDGRLCCRVPSTCCTFFIRNVIAKRYESKLRLYDGWEAGSVGAIWAKEICLAPLGWTLAEHLHKSDLSPMFKGW